MSDPSNWDVNKYYDPTEFIEHWNLRKEFMLTHKFKYPEDRLVGLAKIFYNMEFLGCVYNSELMILVQNLSEQVDAIVQYRDRKKKKLQRTFVKASDAVKRHIDNSNKSTPKIHYVNFIPAKNIDEDDEEGGNDAKRMKMDHFINIEVRPELKKYIEKITNPIQIPSQSEPAFVQIGQQYFNHNEFTPVSRYQMQPKSQLHQTPMQYGLQLTTMQPNQQQKSTQQQTELSKTQQKKQLKQQMQKKNQRNEKYKLRFDLKPEDRDLLNKAKRQHGILGKLVLYETQLHATPYGCLDYSASKVNINMKIVKDEINQKYVLYMDDEHITEFPIIEDPTIAKKTPKGHRKYKAPENVRNDIAEKAFVYFKKYCFTLIDHNTKDFEQISTDNLKNNSTSKPQIELSLDGIGAKMMKQMGWSGQGLGKNSNGILEPIQAEIRVYRRGFGQGTDQAFTKSVRDYFSNYLETGETKRLVFSTDFSKDDRAKVHTIAGQFGILKSRSYGKDENRYITIERKLTGWDIIEQVLANGGSNDCYTLIKPTDL